MATHSYPPMWRRSITIGAENGTRPYGEEGSHPLFEENRYIGRKKTTDTYRT